MTASRPYDTMSTTSRSDPTFTKCCCCIPLRVGCFILGYMYLVFNTFHTLSVLTYTTWIGISTHGFDHFDKVSNQIPAIESLEKTSLNRIGILLIMILFANVAWLFINVACLVGLHKKRPGPIRVYVSFATARLMLSLAGFVYLTMTASANTQTLVTNSADIGLSAYFILVYYIYAGQLEREVAEKQEQEATNVSDIAFVYPTKTDKQILVA